MLQRMRHINHRGNEDVLFFQRDRRIKKMCVLYGKDRWIENEKRDEENSFKDSRKKSVIMENVEIPTKICA